MSQSLKKRFNGNSAEVLEYVGLHGTQKAMSKYGVRDYSAMKRWIKEKTEDENYGDAPKIRASGENAIEAMGDYIVSALQRKFAKMEAQAKRNEEIIEEQRLRIDYLEAQLQKSVDSSVQELLKICEL